MDLSRLDHLYRAILETPNSRLRSLRFPVKCHRELFLLIVRLELHAKKRMHFPASIQDLYQNNFKTFPAIFRGGPLPCSRRPPAGSSGRCREVPERGEQTYHEYRS